MITDGRVGSGVKPEVLGGAAAPETEGKGLEVFDREVMPSVFSRLSLSGKSNGDGESKDDDDCCWTTAATESIFSKFF